MIIVKVYGGLGNQLFQYATGFAAACRSGTSVKVDPSGLHSITRRGTGTKRQFALVDLIPDLQVASKSDLTRYPFPIGTAGGSGPLSSSAAIFAEALEMLRGDRARLISETFSWRVDDRLKNNSSKNLYLSGYWNRPALFSDYAQELIGTIRPVNLNSKMQDLAEEISERKGGVVHVRRTDFVDRYSEIHNVTTQAYFAAGLSLLEKKDRPIYVFSDDLAWCKAAFGVRPGLVFVERSSSDTDASHLWAMSKGSQFVISNSSFSWWAAWLSSTQNKVVYRPTRWTNLETGDKSIYPSDWITLDHRKESD